MAHSLYFLQAANQLPVLEQQIGLREGRDGRELAGETERRHLIPQASVDESLVLFLLKR